MIPAAFPGSEPDSVPATVAPDAAAGIDWHCIVIGAGPAGAATSIRLARQGWRVLLVDRSSMPRPKVCGCCLSPLAVAELAAICPSGTLPAPLPLHTVCLVSAGRSARMPMPGGGVLSRERLDAALVRQAIAAGADWLPNMVVETIHEAPLDCEHARATIVARRAAMDPLPPVHLHGRVAVIAAGLADTIRVAPPGAGGANTVMTPQRRVHDPRGRRVAAGSRIGVGTTLAAAAADRSSGAIDLPVGELVMTVGRHGYCGLIRLEDGRIDLAAAVDRHLLAGEGGPAGAIASLLELAAGAGPWADGLHPILAALPHASFRATPPLTHHSPRIAGVTRRIFRVGDAAGYVEPFTGEGIGWALAGGRLLAESLLAATLLDGIGSASDRYGQAHRRMFAGHHARCRWVAHGVRWPSIVSGAVELATLMPWAARRAVPLLVGATKPRDDGQS